VCFSSVSLVMVDNHQRAVHHRDALKLSERHARGRCMSSVDVAVVNVTLVDAAHKRSEPHAGERCAQAQ